MGPRLINAILGFWLFLSTFLWRHTWQQAVNGWIVGMAVVTFSLLALAGYRSARYGTAVLGAWLILSALLLPRVGMGTYWNNVGVGFLLVMFGLAPSMRSLRRHAPSPG